MYVCCRLEWFAIPIILGGATSTHRTEGLCREKTADGMVEAEATIHDSVERVSIPTKTQGPPKASQVDICSDLGGGGVV